MAIPILLAIVLSSRTGGHVPMTGPMFWEETSIVQKLPVYHPMIRFNSWVITRYGLSTTYMFDSPGMVQQGQYKAGTEEYEFHALMANELENADIAKLIATMDPDKAREMSHAYAVSMFSFSGSYNATNKSLYITYPVDGHPKSFELHATDEGDDVRANLVTESERALLGVWHAPEPFPDKLDAKTQYTVGNIDGLNQFAKQAAESDEAEFSILDLRQDATFRIHSKEGGWRRNGSTLTLTVNGSTTILAISRDGTKLLSEGKVAYVRN